jgi:hydrogenase/urease accessory protein HupE
MPRVHPRADLLAVGMLCAAIAAVAGMGVVQAHEIGTTRVVASFSHDNTFTIEVSADAGALLARLQAARRQPRSKSQTAAEYQQGFDLLCNDVPRYLAVTFDGVVATPRATCVVDAGDPQTPPELNVPGVTVTLRGAMPPGAKTFTWQYGLTFASYALVIKTEESSHEPRATSHEQTIWLEGDEKSPQVEMARVEPPSSRWSVARTYFTLGFTHILPGGADHILFVLGIFLLSRRLKPILLQVSAFTIAHSITLGLTMYGIIALPSSIVEPMIALSIVYVAVENIVTADLKPWRLALVFGFGLLHGMGFAGVLSELALPSTEFLTGLTAFNVGVEAGQLGVILCAFLSVGSWARKREAYRRFVVLPGSAAIASMGLFWTMQRLVF